MTNYEYIKNLDCDDLVELLYLKISCAVCPAYNNCITNSLSCKDNLNKWLTEEQKND